MMQEAYTASLIKRLSYRAKGRGSKNISNSMNNKGHVHLVGLVVFLNIPIPYWRLARS